MAKKLKMEMIVPDYEKVSEDNEPLTTESVQEKSDKEIEEKIVIGISQAEQLQKSGWQLIDCHMTEHGKLYKFKR